MKQQYIDITRRTDLTSVSELRLVLQSTLASLRIGRDTCEKALLCFSEAATNIVEHADNAQQLNLRCYSDHYGWWIEISDDGAQRQSSIDIDSNEAHQLLSEFDLTKESGRGLALISQLTDRVDFDSAMKTPTAGQWVNSCRLGWQYKDADKRPVILVVDDDPVLLKLYSAYLDKEYKVITAADGAEALTLLERNPVNLVVSDIHMPNMNGIALRDALTRSKSLELIPFVFLTMSEDAHIIDQANSLGVDDYLTKPVEKSKLINTVHRVLSRSNRLISCLNERINTKISAALIPSLPTRVPGWKMAIGSRNTGLGGGDLILCHQIEDKTFVVVIDVMGHDETAKFFTYAYGGFIRGLALSMGASLTPDLLLAELSQVVLNDALLSQITLTCCVAELGSGGFLRITSAGHPPPWKICKEGAEPLDVSGVLLGLLPGASYQALSIRCNPGDRLAFYTDGLIDVIDAGEREALEGDIRRCLVDSSDKNLEECVTKVFSLFDERTNCSPMDDALLFLIEPFE